MPYLGILKVGGRLSVNSGEDLYPTVSQTGCLETKQKAPPTGHEGPSWSSQALLLQQRPEATRNSRSVPALQDK